MSARSFLFASTLVSAAALTAACSVYDESLLGGTGGDSSSTRSTSSSEGGADGDGGAGTGAAGPTTTSGGSPTTTGSVSSTGVGSTGSVTTGGGCQSIDECPGEDSECAARTCEDGVCSISATVQGVPLDRQTDGDCVTLVCDGSGGIETVSDDGDLPDDDGNDCTDAVCQGGEPSHVDSDPETGCAQDGGQLCDGAGVCVACLIDDDCVGDERCSDANTCVAAACDDTILNGQETAVDCGGTVCAPCSNGQTCDVDADCMSGACNVTCQPSCTDGALNGSETDVDCGGSCAAFCNVGEMCGSDLDCDTDQCLATRCRPRLYFSEYVEGSGQNKALEITNYGNVALDLTAAACSILMYTNGQTAVGATIGLVGTVDALDVHVLAKSGGTPAPSATLIALADQTSGSLTFSGNDALELVCDGIVIDSIGQVGNDPGATTGWGTDPANTYNNTLRRKAFVTEGDADSADAFDPSVQWDGFPVDEFTGLGDP